MIRALIVDDCELTREMLEFSMKSTASVDHAGDGGVAVVKVREAIEQEAPYDLICLDITMPVMGGLEALRKIREIEAGSGVRKSTVFMITASSSPDDMVEAISEGDCDDYLTKPVTGNAFKELLRKHSLLP